VVDSSNTAATLFRTQPLPVSQAGRRVTGQSSRVAGQEWRSGPRGGHGLTPSRARPAGRPAWRKPFRPFPTPSQAQLMQMTAAIHLTDTAWAIIIAALVSAGALIWSQRQQRETATRLQRVQLGEAQAARLFDARRVAYSRLIAHDLRFTKHAVTPQEHVPQNAAAMSRLLDLLDESASTVAEVRLLATPLVQQAADELLFSERRLAEIFSPELLKAIEAGVRFFLPNAEGWDELQELNTKALVNFVQAARAELGVTKPDSEAAD
jgi:hypothetical protein